MIQNKIKYLDKWLLVPYLILVIFSIIMVFSASSYLGVVIDSNPYNYLYRQMIFVVMGIMLMFIGAMTNVKPWKNSSIIGISAGVVVALLLIVLFMPEINGAKRWIPLGFMNLQPGELAKLFTVWYFSYVLSRKKTENFQLFARSMVKPTALIVGIALLLLLQPDTGTPLTLAIVSYTMVAVSGIDFKKGFKMIAVGSGLLIAVYNIIYYLGGYIPVFGDSYQYKRFLAVRYPFELMQEEGLQLVNSYQALARGGLMGVGINGSVQKTGYLPEAHTDFILSIIGEELGLIAILIIIFLLMLIIARIYVIGIRSKESFYYFICVGIALLFFIQVCLNLGAVSGVLPITGVPFPFLSYGGSSLLMSSLSIGIVLNIRIRHCLDQEEN